MDVLLPEAREIYRAAGARSTAAGAGRSRHGARGRRQVTRAVQDARPQSGAHARGRWRVHDVLAGREPTQLLGPGTWPTPGQSRRLPEFSQARPVLQHPAPDGRLYGRADRHPARHPPPRGAARHLHPDRQADPLLLAGLGQDPRRYRDVPNRARHRPGAARARAVADDDHQHQLAATVGRADGGRHHRDGQGGPDRGPDPVHARRCHGAGDGGRGRGAAERRSAPGPCPGTTGAARCAGDLWRVHQQRRHEVGCARVRHARVHEVRAARRPARPPLQAALPHVQHHRRQLGRRPGDVRVACSRCGPW